MVEGQVGEGRDGSVVGEGRGRGHTDGQDGRLTEDQKLHGAGGNTRKANGCGLGQDSTPLPSIPPNHRKLPADQRVADYIQKGESLFSIIRVDNGIYQFHF